MKRKYSSNPLKGLVLMALALIIYLSEKAVGKLEGQ